MKRLKRWVISLMAGLSLCGTALAADVLKVGVQGSLPPFSSVSGNGKLTGFDVDIAQALCAELKVQCQFVITSWDRMLPSLNARKFDAIISSMSITPEREQLVSFTIPYYMNSIQFIAPRDKPFSTDPRGLKGKVIGAGRATLSADWLSSHLGGQVNMRFYDSQEEANQALADGRVDAVLGDRFAHYAWLQTPEGQRFELKGEPVLQKDRIAIAVRKNDPLKARLDEALKGILANGTYQQINARYFPFSLY
ncbi:MULTISPECIES: transporter substrate-binding domain-containing protein [Pseudomonas]|uniref:transporter substrate-binding domain-containing protein n=1 Tax=Pseudomonas TaxID=286 RepID=UPI00289AE30C|nr:MULTISPECIES: transporter substrate-binding domain-containing protein [Pseudomonas]